jgi:hypothetical protein
MAECRPMPARQTWLYGPGYVRFRSHAYHRQLKRARTWKMRRRAR